MRLLVSVRSAAEANVAAANGADIVDAKEPDAGPLGSVTRSVLHDIEAALPPEVPLGVALGDAGAPDELTATLDRLAPPRHSAGTFLKVGFAGVASAAQVETVLRRAKAYARALGPSAAVIAASYADYDHARAPSPEDILQAAIVAGAAGVLIDTWLKDGRGLLRHLSVDAVGDWVTRARRAGLLTALAGGLEAEDLAVLQSVEPDVVGFRGAVCHGGRTGLLDPARLRLLKALLDSAPARASERASVGEMPEPDGHSATLTR